jgi:two-component system NtrC family sensor kinase
MSQQNGYGRDDDAAGTMPLASRILYGLVPLTLVAIVLVALSSYLTAKRQILGGLNREITTLARQAADNLGAFFDLRREDAVTLAAAAPLQDYLKYLDYGLKEEAAAFRGEMGRSYSRFAREKGVYTRIAYCDLRGREVAAATPAGPASPGPWLRSPAVIPPRGEVRHTDITPGPVGEIVYWTGVYDDKGRPQGYVALVCDLGYARRILRRFRIGENGRVLLVDGEGRELLSSGVAFTDAISGKANIPGTPWGVELTATPAEFLMPLRQVGHWTIALSLSIMGFMFFWVGYLVRKTTRPIVAMAEAARRIAAGDLDFHFQPPRVREVRMLGDAFNDMASSLKERNLLLEARIRELLALRDMEGAVIQRLDEDTILRVCLKAIAEGLAFDRTGLYWVDHAKREIAGRYIYAAGESVLSEQSFRERRIPLGAEEILNEVIRTRGSVHVNAPQQDRRLNQDFVHEAETREFLMAPICGKDRVFGVFVADNRRSGRPLKRTDKDGLTVFANAVGLALENAILFQNLSDSEARYRAVLDNSPEAVLGVSREHRIATWNRGAEGIFGYSAGEIVGKPLAALFPPSEAEKDVRLLIGEVMEKGSVRDFSIAGRARGGKLLALSVSWGGSLPAFWMNKEWTVVIRDVTEAKKLQRQIIQSEKLSAVGQLIAGIAHELNNPLQGVVGYAQFLAADKRLKNKEEVGLIYQSAIRCRKIIENLLFFVRQGSVEKRPVSIQRLVKASRDLLDYKLRKANAVSVTVRLPRGLPSAQGDFHQLQQVLVNLINNACDAMSGQGGDKEIRILASAAEGKLRLEVSDNGPGIALEHQARVFEPFFSTKPEGCGTGLGLAISRQIIADHGGSISFSTRVGEGTTFVIELPAASGPTARPAKPALLGRAPKGKTVLIVDDEPAVLSFLRRVLDAEGCRVETAASLAEALAIAKQRPFDLAISDAHLEDGRGLAPVEQWARGTAFPPPPFLFITGDVLNLSLQKAFSAKGLPLLYKPVDLDMLKGAVRALLRGEPIPEPRLPS